MNDTISLHVGYTFSKNGADTGLTAALAIDTITGICGNDAQQIKESVFTITNPYGEYKQDIISVILNPDVSLVDASVLGERIRDALRQGYVLVRTPKGRIYKIHA